MSINVETIEFVYLLAAMLLEVPNINQDLFEDSDDKVPGITNLSKQKLNDGENVAVERIEVNFAPLAASVISYGNFLDYDEVITKN